MEKITVAWANEQHTIILVTYHTNDWEWPDFAHAFDEQRDLLDHAEVPVVHIIVDVIHSQLMPSGGSLLSASRNLSKDIHPRQGHTVIVGARGLIAKMLDIAGNFIGSQRSKLHVAPSLESAYEMIDRLVAQPEKQQA